MRSLGRPLGVPLVVAMLAGTLWTATGAPPLAIHTIDADDAVLSLAARTGFRAVVQLLEWRQVEPAPGEHYWEYADWLVRACQHYGLDLVLRLDHPPDWALQPDRSPPVETDAYAAFVEKVARRYQGRVQAYIIWNEPNLALEWAGRPPDPQGYVRLLQAGTQAIRRADPGAGVIAAGLAPTNQDDDSAMSDLAFLRALYPLDGRPTWDAQAVHPYGFAHAPETPVSAHDGLVFSRLDLWRQVLDESGYASMPLWITEFGWTVGPTEEGDAWQIVSPEMQARYLAGALEAARRAFPRVEFVAAWNLAPGLPPDEPMSGYSLVAHDGESRPALGALSRRSDLAWRRVARSLRGLWRQLAPGPAEVEVLAPDVTVRLSDTATPYVHWAKPHGGVAPARHWSASFYVGDPSGEWELVLETMQVEERANFVYINDRRLAPLPVPGRTPFSSVWTTSRVSIPADRLRSGANHLRIELSPRLRTQQDVRHESMQIRNVRLRRR